MRVCVCVCAREAVGAMSTAVFFPSMNEDENEISAHADNGGSEFSGVPLANIVLSLSRSTGMLRGFAHSRPRARFSCPFLRCGWSSGRSQDQGCIPIVRLTS